MSTVAVLPVGKDTIDVPYAQFDSIVMEASGTSDIQWVASSAVGRILGPNNTNGRIIISPFNDPSDANVCSIDMQTAAGTIDLNTRRASGHIQFSAQGTGALIKFSTLNVERWFIASGNAFASSTTNTAPTIQVGSSGVTTSDCSVRIGLDRAGNGWSYLDLVGDTTYTQYGLRIIRENSGANAPTTLIHRGTGNFQISRTEAAQIEMITNNVSRWLINSGGTFYPAAHLTYNIGANGVAANAVYAASYPGPSDINRKRDIEAIPQYGLDAVLSMNPIKYKYKKFLTKPLKKKLAEAGIAPEEDFTKEDVKAAADARVFLGLSAQEVKALVPEAVFGEEENFGLCVDYTKLVPVLIQAVKDLHALVQEKSKPRTLAKKK